MADWGDCQEILDRLAPEAYERELDRLRAAGFFPTPWTDPAPCPTGFSLDREEVE